MARRRYYDFDRQFAEMKRETYTMKVFGKEYTFPAVIPADIPLMMARYGDEKNIPVREILNAARRMFGTALDEWRQHPEFGVDNLGDLLRAAFEIINGTDEPETEEITEDDAGGETKN